MHNAAINAWFLTKFTVTNGVKESKLESEGQTQASQIATILKEMKELRFIVQTKLDSSSTTEKTDIPSPPDRAAGAGPGRAKLQQQVW